MITDIIPRVLIYNPKTGALIWRDTGLPATTRGQHGHYVYVNGQTYYAARVAWLLAKGKWPRRITFLNGDKFDMRMHNMRELTPAERKDHDLQREYYAKQKAARARSKLPRGVIQCRDTGRYYARVLVRGHIEVSPRVDTPEQARTMRDAILNPQTT